MLVLGIETSCDETGVALYDSEKGLLAEALYSQIALHAEYGGVVPELASRDHVRKLPALIDQVMLDSGLVLDDLDAIAYTAGPGLVGALLTGTCTAHALAWSLNIPALAIHHMEGHLFAPMLSAEPIDGPFVALLVSGGHTQLVYVERLGQYQLLGETLDDAVGEAFDKTAKLMGLPYPGGPALSKLAEQGNVERFKFPRPMTDRPGLDFSFSGLKTFTANTFRKHEQEENIRADVAAAFQKAAVDTLRIKCKRAMKQTGATTLLVSGGVSANQSLRETLNHTGQKAGFEVSFPAQAYCTDNGAMIAYVGCQRLMAGEQPAQTPMATPRWPLERVHPPGSINEE